MTACPHAQRLQPISVIVVWYGAPRPRVIPAEGDARICVGCEELFVEVDAGLQAKGIPVWTKALVIAVDGQRVEIVRRSDGQPTVLA